MNSSRSIHIGSYLLLALMISAVPMGGSATAQPARPVQQPAAARWTAIRINTPDAEKWELVRSQDKTRLYRCRNLSCPYPAVVFARVSNSPGRSIDAQGLRRAAQAGIPQGIRNWQARLDQRGGTARRVELLSWRTGRVRGHQAVFQEARMTAQGQPDRFIVRTTFFALDARVEIEAAPPSRDYARTVAGAFAGSVGIREGQRP